MTIFSIIGIVIILVIAILCFKLLWAILWWVIQLIAGSLFKLLMFGFVVYIVLHMFIL